MQNKKISIHICLLVFVILSFGTTYSKDADSIKINEKWPKYSFAAGGFINNMSTSAYVGGADIPIGVEVNVEEVLGIESHSFSFRGSFLYRFSKNRRHAVSLSYFSMNRRANKTISKGIEIGPYKYEAGTHLSTKLNIGVFDMKYHYSFLLDERMNIRGQAGFYTMPISFSLKRDEVTETVGEVLAPLPMIGVGASIYLTEDLRLIQNANILYFQFRNMAGNMIDYQLLFEYDFYDNFAVGIGYNSFSIDFLIEDNELFWDLEFNGRFRYKHSGLIFYCKAMF